MVLLGVLGFGWVLVFLFSWFSSFLWGWFLLGFILGVYDFVVCLRVLETWFVLVVGWCNTDFCALCLFYFSLVYEWWVLM